MATMLAMSPAERAAMGERGRANVLARFSVGTMTNATLAIYAKLLAPAHASHDAK
jgi:hypothetical protein